MTKKNPQKHVILGTPPTFVRTTLAEQVHEAIKERILDQTLEPGARLSIDSIARELGVSSSPVREALIKLEGERLVVCELYAGYRVSAHPQRKHLYDLLDYRILLESHCARLGAGRSDPMVVASLEEQMERMLNTPILGTKYREYADFVQADSRFHHIIVDSAQNEVMSDVYVSLNALILQSRLYLTRQGGSVSSEEVIDEHRSILQAYRDGNGERAAQMITAHLEGGRRRLLKFLPEE